MKVEVSLTISLNRSSLHYWQHIRPYSSEENVQTHLGRVHLVYSDDELTHTEGERQKSVFTGLTVLGDTSLKLTGTTGDNEDGTVSLGGAGDHVFDEITVSRGVNNLMFCVSIHPLCLKSNDVR